MGLLLLLPWCLKEVVQLLESALVEGLIEVILAIVDGLFFLELLLVDILIEVLVNQSVEIREAILLELKDVEIVQHVAVEDECLVVEVQVVGEILVDFDLVKQNLVFVVNYYVSIEIILFQHEHCLVQDLDVGLFLYVSLEESPATHQRMALSF